jgi:hypothetical protein
MLRRFDGLSERLLAAGIAPRYVRRYLAELSDHLDDLIEDERAGGKSVDEAETRACARLGAVRDLADTMIARREFRSLSARVPWLVFGLAPPFVLLLLMLVPALALIGAAYLFTDFTDSTLIPVEFKSAAAALCGVANLAAGPLAALVFIVLGLRQHMRPLWTRLGFAVATLCAAFATLDISIPAMRGMEGIIGISFFSDLPMSVSGSRLCFTLAFAVAVHLLLESRHKSTVS